MAPPKTVISIDPRFPSGSTFAGRATLSGSGYTIVDAAPAMNYRHAFHAGNHADVLKHVVLLALLDALLKKDAPFFVLDTHAGRGEYPLESDAQRKTAESDDGILKLSAAPPAPPAVERYLRAVQDVNPPGRLQRYPGSPVLVANALRAGDRLAACELQPDEAAALKTLFHGNPQVAAHARDGYDAVHALLPPRDGGTRIGRGLVLIDPPYESQQDEYPKIIDALRSGLAQWPQGVFAVWYPIKQRRSILHFLRKATALPAKSVFCAELLVRPDDSPLRLNGSGMLVLNPPWQVDAAISSALPALQAALGEPGASSALRWLRRAE